MFGIWGLGLGGLRFRAGRGLERLSAPCSGSHLGEWKNQTM